MLICFQEVGKVEEKLEVLLCMGRGIQRPNPTRDYETTWYLEMLGEDGCHQLVREAVDETSDRCMIGGGWLNVEAAAVLSRRYQPQEVLFAYGNTRTPEFKAADGPFEGKVMEREFMELMHRSGRHYFPQTHVWIRDEEKLCNSYYELINAFDFMVTNGLNRIGIVTVAVHLPRVRLFVAGIQHDLACYREFDVRFFSSEEVLLREDWETWAPIVDAGWNSPAYVRTTERERTGTLKFLRGAYQREKPPV